MEKREEIQEREHQPNWYAQDANPLIAATMAQLEKTKTSIPAKVEHGFRVIKRQLGYVKVKYRELAKNTANLMTLFAPSNLWMARKALMKLQEARG